jgi:processive 1,2-diacylglycerol beta-glucosyltransferase
LTSPRILLCSAAVGHGHCRAAQVLGATLAAAGASTEFLEALSFAPGWFNSIYRSGYLSAIKRVPAAQRWLYHSTDHPCNGRSGGERLERHAMKAFAAAAAAHKPDLILCSHFLCTRVLCSAREAGLLKAPIAVCVTDLHPHGVWLRTQADLFLLASTSAADHARAQGIDPSRILPVGIPVDPAFGSTCRATARAALGIPSETPTILFTGGGLGLGGLDAAVEGALAAPALAHIIVVCGRDEALRARLHTRLTAANRPFTLLGFTDQMPQLMAAADVLVGKPGGLTTAEAMASTLPMVLLQPIPGQEEANASALVASKAAVLEQDPRAAGARAARLAFDPTTLHSMKAAIAGSRSRFDPIAARDRILALLPA